MEHDRFCCLPVQLICLDKLLALVDLGANPWGVGEIRAHDVLGHRTRKSRLPASFDWQPDAWDYQWTREDHLQRIAELMEADPTQIEPVLLDVGEADGNTPWPVVDGHHRILAAWFMGQSHIQARVAGDTARAERMLGGPGSPVPPMRPRKGTRP